MKLKAVKIFNDFIDLLKRNRSVRYTFIFSSLTFCLSVLLLSLNAGGATYDYNLGDIAIEDIKVYKDIHYINKSETDIKIKRAAESVPLVFDRDALVLVESLKVTDLLFAGIKRTLTENPPIGTDDLTFQLIALKSKLPGYVSFPDSVLLELLSYRYPVSIRRITQKILMYVYDSNEILFVEKRDFLPDNLENKNISIRMINVESGQDEISSDVFKIVSADEMSARLKKICYSIAPNLPQATLGALERIILSLLQPNVQFNEDETKRRIDEAVSQVKPVMGIMKKGLNIAREGDVITAESLNKIHILNRQAKSSNISYIGGLAVLHIIVLTIFIFFLYEYRKKIFPDLTSVMVLFSVIIFFLLYAFFISKSETVMESKITFTLLLPIPFVTMIMASLFNIYLAAVAGIMVIAFSLFISGGDLSSVTLSFVLAMLGTFANRKIQKRTDFIKAGLIIGFFSSVVLLSMFLIEEIPPVEGLNLIQLAFASGIINSILVLGVYPVYETIFGITTKFRLLELADLNAEIFKKMLVSAPGTYNHSLLVSTMAETACKEIEANHILARVGAFYHDIGKIEDPGMYIENKITDPRAAVFTPEQYASLIIEHIEKGVDIARKNRLPEAVIDFIKEHHGTSVITYFYHQALESASERNNGESIDKSFFRYRGPKPRSRETAVVMLADAIEAASRSLEEPSYLKLEGLVRKIIYNRLNEGELENSDLTMSDLSRIQGVFLNILNGIFHARIKYPDKETVAELEKRIINN